MPRWEVYLHLTRAALSLLLFGLVLLVLTSCQTTGPVSIQCPQLAPPTASIVDALEQAGRKDPSSGAWVIALEKHYEKLDACP